MNTRKPRVSNAYPRVELSDNGKKILIQLSKNAHVLKLGPAKAERIADRVIRFKNYIYEQKGLEV
jgi:hypothetical protein